MSAGGRLVAVLHPVIITGDMEKALAFYRDLLGFTVTNEMEHDAGALARLGGPVGAEARAVVLTAPDGSEIEVACFTAPRGKPRADARWQDAGIRSVTFVVEGLDSLLARLAAAGFSPAGDVVPFTLGRQTVQVVYVNGPDGVILTLLEKGIPA
jgi:catechol 2,3-dioxygenase-like lactoylglutathione lyase family enzyme